MTVALAAVAALLVIGCTAGAGAPGETVAKGPALAVQYVHDDQRGVGCWLVSNSDHVTISCLADKEYLK